MDNSRRISPTLFLAIALFLFFGFVGGVNAEDSDYEIRGRLIYEREFPNGAMQVVTLTAEGRNVFDVDPDECYEVSAPFTMWTGTMDYLVIAAREQPDLLRIYNLDNGTLRFEIPFDGSAWTETCHFGWEGDRTLKVFVEWERETNIFQETYFTLDVINGEFVLLIESVTTLLERVFSWYEFSEQLPGFRPDHSIAIRNPGTDFAIYSACTGEQRCDWGVMLFDLVHWEVVEYLENHDHLRQSVHGVSIGSDSFAFSPTGRYLAYINPGENGLTVGGVTIYDLETRQYSHYIALKENHADWGLPLLTWSPDETKLFFQSAQDSNTWVSVIYIIDVEAETYRFLEETEIVDHNHTLRWSPDSQALVFIHRDSRQLVYYDYATDERVILDDDVTQVLSWNPIE